MSTPTDGWEQLPAKRQPAAAIEVVDTWAALSDGERKRRAAVACRDDDEEALLALLEAYVLLFSPRGLDVAKNTLRAYRAGAREWLRWCQEQGLKPHQARRQDALLFARHLQDKGLKPATVNLKLAAVKRLWEGLDWCGLVRGIEMKKLRVRDPVPRESKAHPYSAEDVERLAEAADARERAVILLGAHEGLRATEIVGLKWRDVDLAREQLTVVAGKGGKTADVALSSGCVEALAVLYQRRNADARVIDGREGGRITSRHLTRIMKDLCARAGVKYLAVHALRHAAGTRFQAATKDLMMTRRHLRHSSVMNTAIYVHLADADYRAAMATAFGK